MERHVGKHTREQTIHLGGDGDRDSIQLGLGIGGLVHGADGAGEGGTDGADGHIHAVADGELGHQRLGDGDGNLELVHPVDDGHGHGAGDKAVLLCGQGQQYAGDRGNDVAAGIHIFQSGGQLFHAGFGALDTGLKL